MLARSRRVTITSRRKRFVAERRMSAGTLPVELTEPLARLESRVRSFAVTRGVSRTLLFGSACLGLAVMADLLIELPLALRIGMLAGGVVSTMVAGLWWIVRPWRREYETRDLATL